MPLLRGSRLQPQILLLPFHPKYFWVSFCCPFPSSSLAVSHCCFGAAFLEPLPSPAQAAVVGLVCSQREQQAGGEEPKENTAITREKGLLRSSS